MSATVSITEDDVTTALRTFLLSVVYAGVEVVLGQDNLVGEPEADNFIVMTPTRRGRLATNVDTWSLTDPNPTAIDHLQPTQVDVQLDIHGKLSTDLAQIISTTFRDEYCVEVFEGIGIAMRPLNADDGHQVPFLNAENQYETRWVMNLSMQIDPVVSTNQQFANTLGPVGLIEVDTTYPP